MQDTQSGTDEGQVLVGAAPSVDCRLIALDENAEIRPRKEFVGKSAAQVEATIRRIERSADIRIVSPLRAEEELDIPIKQRQPRAGGKRKERGFVTPLMVGRWEYRELWLANQREGDLLPAKK